MGAIRKRFRPVRTDVSPQRSNLNSRLVSNAVPPLKASPYYASLDKSTEGYGSLERDVANDYDGKPSLNGNEDGIELDDSLHDELIENFGGTEEAYECIALLREGLKKCQSPCTLSALYVNIVTNVVRKTEFRILRMFFKEARDKAGFHLYLTIRS